MIVSGTNLSYEIPHGWRHFMDGNRLVFQGEQNEELIISGSRIQGSETQTELASIKERLFGSAVTSINNAAAHPELIITKPLEKDLSNQELSCWTLRSQTVSGDTLFIESVISTDVGVTLITFEAPNTSDSEEIYMKFIRSIRINSEEV